MDKSQTTDSAIPGIDEINRIMLAMSTLNQALVVEYISERYPQFDYERQKPKWNADTPLLERFGLSRT